MKKTFLLIFFCPLLLATQVPLPNTQKQTPSEDSTTPSTSLGTPSTNLSKARFMEITLGLLPHLRFGLIIPIKNQNLFLKPAFGTNFFYNTIEIPLNYKLGQGLYVGSSFTLGILIFHPDYRKDPQITVDSGIQFGGKINNNCEWSLRLNLMPNIYSSNKFHCYNITDAQSCALFVNNCIGFSSKF